MTFRTNLTNDRPIYMLSHKSKLGALTSAGIATYMYMLASLTVAKFITQYRGIEVINLINTCTA